MSQFFNLMLNTYFLRPIMVGNGFFDTKHMNSRDESSDDVMRRNVKKLIPVMEAWEAADDPKQI
jgi:hypothetical protein